jgi:hypothetical protein
MVGDADTEMLFRLLGFYWRLAKHHFNGENVFENKMSNVFHTREIKHQGTQYYLATSHYY